MKDEFNSLDPRRQPGPLAEALGGRVEQFYALDSAVPVADEQISGTATIWAEQLSTTNPETKILLRYGKSNGWLDNQPAVITRNIGTGSITYIGALLDAKLLANILTPFEPKLRPLFQPLPSNIELCRRIRANREILILINHSNDPTTATPLVPVHDILNNTTPTTINLSAQGVTVLETISAN